LEKWLETESWQELFFDNQPNDKNLQRGAGFVAPASLPFGD
jgi:hypothetical protein